MAVDGRSGAPNEPGTAVLTGPGASVTSRASINIRFVAPRATTTTTTSTAGRVVHVGLGVHAPPFGPNGNGYSLQYATSPMP